MAGPSSTILLNSIVDVGIVNDIVGEIVTSGRAFRLSSKAGAPRTDHYQLVRALSADAVVTEKECNSGV